MKNITMSARAMYRYFTSFYHVPTSITLYSWSTIVHWLIVGIPYVHQVRFKLDSESKNPTGEIFCLFFPSLFFFIKCSSWCFFGVLPFSSTFFMQTTAHSTVYFSTCHCQFCNLNSFFHMFILLFPPFSYILSLFLFFSLFPMVPLLYHMV